MGCCGDDHSGDKPRADLVPASERSCTDLAFLLVFFLSFGGVAYVYQDSLDKGGDPRRLVQPSDFEGNFCGSSGTGGRRHGAWPDPVNAPLFRVCVESCEDTQNSSLFALPVQSVDFLELYCLPIPVDLADLALAANITGEVAGRVDTPAAFEDGVEAVGRAMGDIEATWRLILISPFIALGMAFLWTFLVRMIAGVIVWLTVALTVAGASFLGYTLLEQADEFESDPELDDNRAKYARITGYVFIGLAVMFLLLVIALRKRIRIAIGVIKEASRAVVDMPCVVCVPVIPIALGVLYAAMWVYVSLVIFSVGEYVETEVPESIKGNNAIVSLLNPEYDASTWVQPDASGNATYQVFVWDEDQRYVFAYHFFHLLYFMAFCIYLAYAVLAGAVAEWYFTPYVSAGHKPRGAGKDELSKHAVVNSCARTVRFHLGTISVGALIIGIVRFIRALLVYLEAKMTPKEGEPNRLVKCIFCACHCLCYCVECCLDKINKNAFIWMAIWGDNFATSACSSFALVWRNLLRVAVLEMVGDYLMLVGKIMIAFATAGAFSFYMTNDEAVQSEISSVLVPSVLIFVLAYTVAGLYMTVFETTVDTTFLCFLVDEENNSPNLCASKELCDVVDAYQAENAHAANKRLKKRSPSQYPGGQPPRGMESPAKSSSMDTEMQAPR